MPDREKTIKDLRALSNIAAYNGDIQSMRTMDNAIALLEEQEPWVMMPYEAAEYEIVWLDRKDISCEVAILQRTACSMYEFSIMGTDEMPSLLESQYGKTWRCWTSRPSWQMREAKWEAKEGSDAEIH